MVAQKKMTLRQRLFMGLSCALLGHDLQSSEGEVITALWDLLEIPQVRSNIAPFAFVTALFDAAKMLALCVFRAVRSDVICSSHRQRLRLHFRRLTGAMETAPP
jgi:hypothetical protein